MSRPWRSQASPAPPIRWCRRRRARPCFSKWPPTACRSTPARPRARASNGSFKAPEANLFNTQNLQVGTHFAGPTWKADDGSTVVGEVAARADAPAGGAIPWLLLRAKSNQGSGVLSTVAFIRRADTKGGVAPAAGCDAARSGAQARVRYYALYQFFGAAK